MVNHSSRHEQTFGNGLAAEAERVWRNRCPCCRRVMTKPAGKLGKLRRTDRTMGHDMPFQQEYGAWLWICSECNSDQGTYNFAGWALWLAHSGDPRAAFVREVAELVNAWRHKARKFYNPKTAAAAFALLVARSDRNE